MLSLVLKAVNSAAINVTDSTRKQIEASFIKRTEEKNINKQHHQHTVAHHTNGVLPPDTLVNVFTFLTAGHVANVCSRVCQEWRALVVHDETTSYNNNSDERERFDRLWRQLYCHHFHGNHIHQQQYYYYNHHNNNQQPQQQKNHTTVTKSANTWKEEYENKLKEITHPCHLCQEKCTFAKRMLDRPLFIKACKCPIGYVHVRCWNHTRRYKNEEFLVVKSYRNDLPYQRCGHCGTRYKLREDPDYDGKYFSDKESLARRRMNLSPLVLSVVALGIYGLLERFHSLGYLPQMTFYFFISLLVLTWLLIMLIILEVNARFYNDEMVKKYYLVDFNLAPDNCDQTIHQCN